MKHRWMDVVKRSTLARAVSSPKSTPKDRDAPPPPPPLSSGPVSSSSSASSLTRRRSFALALAAIGDPMASPSSADEPERGGYAHFAERCETVGDCSVPKVLELCTLQGGVHHTHMNILTYLGNPLRESTCCYVLAVQWYRAIGDRDDFRMIPGAHHEWFTPTADDIGARILVKVMIHDEDAIRTKLLEYGPIKEDPEVRSKVELYLERKSVLFMGLESVLVQDGENYPNNVDMRELWTLLIDDRRVRLTCESSLLPPFEGFYTSSIRVEIVRETPNEFRLYLAEDCFVHLRAESNIVRDIIVLTLRAFCKSAVSSELINDAIAKGISPMLTIRTLAAAEQQQQQQGGRPPVSSPPSYNLPWNRPTASADAILFDEDDDDDSDGSSDDGRSRSPSDGASSTSHVNGSGTVSLSHNERLDEAVLQDADALIGNAMKMGLQHQLLPRAPKRISITEIPDLQIIEAMANGHGNSNSATTSSRNEENNDPVRRRRRRHRSRDATGDDAQEEQPQDASGTRCSRKAMPTSADDGSDAPDTPVPGEDGSESASESESEAGDEDDDDKGDEEPTRAIPRMDGATIDEAIVNFHQLADDRGGATAVAALRTQYVAIFCELQRELSESKARATKLTARLDQTTEENVAFRRDIATLQDALTSMQVAEKVKELVTNDLAQLIRAQTPGASPHKALPQNFY